MPPNLPPPPDQRKIVYDGKRIQPVYERRMIDYSSALIYEEFSFSNSNSDIGLLPSSPMSLPYNRNAKYLKDLDLSSQIIHIPPINKNQIYKQYPVKFMQMCINKQRSPINTIAWAPNGRRLLSGANSGEITMWNGLYFNFDTILQGHTYPIKKIQFSRNSNLLISGDSKGSLKYWNTSMSNLNAIENVHTEAIKDLSFSWNDNIFATASDDASIKLIDTNTCKVIRELNGHNWDIRKAQFHPEYSLIASGGKDNLLKFWDPRTSECLVTYHYHKNTILSMDIQKNYLITGGKDQVIKQLDFRTMKEIFTYKASSDITALRFLNNNSSYNSDNDNDNLSFASGNALGEIIFWENFDGVPVDKTLESHENTVWCLEVHPAGHILASGSADFQIKFWGRFKYGDYDQSASDNNDNNREGMNFDRYDNGVIPGL